jgi:molecular chaperone GrpE (heat shock protein)
MNKIEFEIRESLLPVPAQVEEADPKQAMANSIQLAARLRGLLLERRTENRASTRALLLKLLEVADALERILAIEPDPGHPSEVRRWNDIRVTRRLLDQVLRLEEVTSLDLVGQEADPTLCEIEGYATRPDLPEETVVQEAIKGYRWGKDASLLRPAVVIVSQK